ncbi:unnamed protein product [Adineta ricciae]|uniref:Uncharacterized protein n=1 Tax=Adineta ricciae TaxID=249248 RepID=A0A813SID2_ADIRI|nr:unnamed protein product [Adineta ricciae]
METDTTQCFKCKKYKKITYLCKGCSNEFCQTDLIEHRQLLNEELDVIINDYDQFRQTINQHERNSPSNSSLMRQINEWERKSMQKIQQMADTCRKTVLEETKTFIHTIGKNFSQLGDQIKEMRKEEEFNEIDLNELRRKLKAMTDELNNPSTISLQEDSQPFITQISVFVSKNRLQSSANRRSISNIQRSLIEQTGSKFRATGTVVAGGNGCGNQLNQLNRPIGISIDSKKNIFIADCGNNRIVEWKCYTNVGEIIAGRNGYGNGTDQLNSPSDVIINEESRSIIIADRGNNRVIRSSLDRDKERVLIVNIDCYSIAMYKHQSLYVSDWNKNDVTRWKTGENHYKSITSRGELRREISQLNGPSFVFVDEDESVYVSDIQNHRVMKWNKNAREGIVVAGGNGNGINLNQLSYPRGLYISSCGEIYVADYGNNRVMRWREGDLRGEVVVGGNGEGNKLNQLFKPEGLAFDLDGNLYVADRDNHRIMRFDKIF